MDLGLKGKVALVTGAGRGVGREIALSLAAEGAAVAVNYRSSAKDAETLVAEITGKGGKAKAYAADVADFAAVKAMVEAVVKDFGGLDILDQQCRARAPQTFRRNQRRKIGRGRSTPASMARSIAATPLRRISRRPATAASSA